jgi:hypothetical protein
VVQYAVPIKEWVPILCTNMYYSPQKHTHTHTHTHMNNNNHHYGTQCYHQIFCLDFSVIYMNGLETKLFCAKSSSILLDTMPWSPLKVDRCFGWICSLHFQGWRDFASCLLHAGFLLGLLFNRWLTSNELHGVMFQNIELFIIQDVRASNPILCIWNFYISKFKEAKFFLSWM